METIKCVVSGFNSQGQPDFWFVKVRTTEEQREKEFHYDAASAHAVDNGFEIPGAAFGAPVVYDPQSVSKDFFDLFEWKSASTIDADY